MRLTVAAGHTKNMVVATPITQGIRRRQHGSGDPFEVFARMADGRDDRADVSDPPGELVNLLLLARTRKVLPQARLRLGDKMRLGLLTLWTQLASLWQIFAALQRRADCAAATKALSTTRAREAQLPPASLSSLIDINLCARLLPMPFACRA